MKILPQNLQAEKSLLGSLLVDKDAMYKILDLITPNDFYNLSNQRIFKACLDCFHKNKKIDLVILSDYFGNKVNEIGGVSYLAGLSNALTSSHIIDYAKIIKDKSLRRQLIQAQFENESIISNEELNINSVISNVQNKIFKINPLKTKSDHITSILVDLEERQKLYAEKYEQGKTIIGYSSGIDKLDKAIDGLQEGHFWTIGSWHGVGKTSFALNIIHEVLMQNVPVSIISLEMGQVDITTKIMSIRNGISQQRIIKGKNDDAVQGLIQESKNFISKTNLEIHTEFDIDKIKMQIRKDFYIRGVKVVMIDYIQKIRHEKIYDETPLMSRASIELANLAQELRITIILLSQISNESKKGGGAGAGYKGTGTIEAVSDLAIILKRDKEKEEADAEFVPVKIHITKNKFGFDGSFDYWLHLKSGQFNDKPELKPTQDILKLIQF